MSISSDFREALSVVFVMFLLSSTQAWKVPQKELFGYVIVQHMDDMTFLLGLCFINVWTDGRHALDKNISFKYFIMPSDA